MVPINLVSTDGKNVDRARHIQEVSTALHQVSPRESLMMKNCWGSAQLVQQHMNHAVPLSGSLQVPAWQVTQKQVVCMQGPPTLQTRPIPGKTLSCTQEAQKNFKKTFLATFRVARLTLQNRKHWLVGRCRDRL